MWMADQLQGVCAAERAILKGMRLFLLCRRAIRRSDCFHANINDPCHLSNNPWIVLFGAMQIVFSQIQDIDRIWFMSVIATVSRAQTLFVSLMLSHSLFFLLKGRSADLQFMPNGEYTKVHAGACAHAGMPA